MKNPGAHSLSRTPVWLALLALAVQSLAWWWVARTIDGFAAWLALALGVSGTLLAAAAAWLLMGSHDARQRELRQARAAAERAQTDEDATHQAQLEAEQASLLLVTALDALPIGIAIFDQHDRQVIRNRYLDELLPGLFARDGAQTTFETMLRREYRLGLLPEGAGREDDWIAERLSQRGLHAKPLLQRSADDRWIHTYEVETPQGFTVVARTEVTDLVRKEQMLAHANEQLSRQSATDGLTGIANRRKFDEVLGIEWLRAARSGAVLSLLMVDIDHFKLFNDHYGHLAGDECLRRVSQVLAGCVRRAGEMLARYGGEEFVMLMPGADRAQAEDMAQRCLNRIRQAAIAHGSSPTSSLLTLSIGIASVQPSAGGDPGTLVNAADTAMYRAKMRGRARHEVADVADWEIDKDTHRTRPGELT